MKLVFLTQRLDESDPVLAATVPMVRALAARVDELVVLCDGAAAALPANVRVHEFGAPVQALRGARFEAALARELRPRPDGAVAHMVPLYAVLAAPLVRPLRIPLVLWYTHWKAHAVVRAAEKMCTAIASVDVRSFPLASAKVHAIGHGIDLSEFSCTDAPPPPLRALVLGRYSPAKGLETILRAAQAAEVRVEAHGTDEGF
jgi:glycosyltransferase involved in cell wall biosynthesis